MYLELGMSTIEEFIASYDYATLVIEEGGTHPFETVERHCKLIRSFLLENT